MRKISKSCTDDDVISSTNGSIVNDSNEPVEPESANEAKEGDAQADENGGKVDNSQDEPRLTPKKKAAKNKTKKRKSEKVEEEEEYEVEKIIDEKKIKGKLHYLIRWKGYSADNDTWEPEHTVSCPELVNKFNEEKENSKEKVETPKAKSNKKRKAQDKKSKTPSKRAKSDWDSSNADENAEYEVDRILEVHHKKNGQREFLIHWKGWSSKFDSWEPESNLNCSELIKRFMDKVNAARSTDTRNLRVAPGSTNRFTLQAHSTGRRLSKRKGQRQRVRYDNAE